MHTMYAQFFWQLAGLQGAKMKETFLKTGSLQEVDIVVQRMSNQSVKDEDTEKPVTKLMLKEIYKWDESYPQGFETNL